MGAVAFIFRRKMTKSQAFWSGFWSAWDFSRPFSERLEIRAHEAMRVDYEQLREEFGLNESVWDSVGKYLSNAMSTIDKELEHHVPHTQ